MAEALAPLSDAARGRVRQRQPFVWRLQGWLSNYLPLGVMALLAALTLWLVRVTPLPQGPTAAVAPRHKPDFEMKGFEMQRFGADGAPQAWLRGEAMRHYPDTDMLEFDSVQVRAQNADGDWLLLQAQQGKGPRDGSVLWLSGGVTLTQEKPQAQAPALRLSTPALELHLDDQRARSRDNTRVEQGPRQSLRVQGFDYEHASGRLRFGGPSRTEILPRTP